MNEVDHSHDDDRDLHRFAETGNVEGLVLAGNVADGRDGGLDHEDVAAGFLRHHGEPHIAKTLYLLKKRVHTNQPFVIGNAQLIP